MCLIKIDVGLIESGHNKIAVINRHDIPWEQNCSNLSLWKLRFVKAGYCGGRSKPEIGEL